MMVRFCRYTPLISCKIVRWKWIERGKYKCKNTSKENPCPSSSALCIKNGDGKFVYAEIRRLNNCTILVAEVIAIRIGLEHCQ